MVSSTRTVHLRAETIRNLTLLDAFGSAKNQVLAKCMNTAIVVKAGEFGSMGEAMPHIPEEMVPLAPLNALCSARQVLTL